jgi:hypothetical protein
MGGVRISRDPQRSKKREYFRRRSTVVCAHTSSASDASGSHLAAGGKLE